MKLFLTLIMFIWSGAVYTENRDAASTGNLSYFVRIKSSTMNDPKIEMKSRVSLENCAVICLDNIRCTSFEYDKKKQTCFISRKSAKTYPIQFHATHDYYQAIIPDEKLIGMKGVGVPDIIKLEQFRDLSIDHCDAKCGANPTCKSYTYKSRTKLCNLSNVTYMNQELEISKYGWDIYFINQEKKEINCGSPPRLDFKSVSYSSTIYKSQTKYHCSLGETFIANCRIDGRWSKPNGTCKRPTTCEEFKRCGEFVNDGEYWIYPAGLHGKKLKVYCSGMQTAHPEEYISLMGENFSYYPARKILLFCYTRSTLSWQTPGRTIFNKIRINPKNLKIDSTDFKFAELVHKSGNTMWGYGIAADCLFKKDSYCQSQGEMKIDLTDTGLAVDRKVSWTNFGTDSHIDKFKRSRNGQVVTATCGGHCGGCKPLSIILVAAKTGPADAAAKTCENL